ncbi:MAG: sodium:proton antiporter NhaD [Flavobacteriaceae bacterium]|nr:sodium:proton antiporter NhaD [Flavobacteriaceae bacterium]
MEIILISIFILGYLLITLEHSLKIDKLIPALGMMALLWALISLSHLPVFEVNTTLKELQPTRINEVLLHHLGKTAEILIFLLGAMTIVEIIDYFNGFFTIKSFIKTTSKKSLLYIFAFLAFILSAIIDNLTATIVLITILQKVIKDRNTRLWFAGLIVICANAGGAWSPIGDVTTTMLWIGKKVSTVKLISYLLIPSLVCAIVPVIAATFLPAFKGNISNQGKDDNDAPDRRGAMMLYLGLSAIIFVPVFKVVTNLPPYVGMMLSLAVVATFAEILSKSKINITSIDEIHDEDSSHSPVHKSLSKIELPSILFFLGILMAVAALESLGMLFEFAGLLNDAIPNTDIVVILLGIGSAVIDNVPLVAASMGMFSELIDHPLWHFIAFSAGTGGSMLIIGSAAGVVAMGMERIDFFWYLKKITWLAAIGFLSGSFTFILIRNFFL